MIIRNLIVTLCFYLSLYFTSAKESLVRGILEAEKSMAIIGDYNLSASANVFDGYLIESYLRAFNADLEMLRSSKEILKNNTLDKNFSLKTLKYFLYVQSQLINEVQNPFESSKQSLEVLNFDFQFSEDPEIINFMKLNFLALMEFWKEYIWIYHIDSTKNTFRVHDTYLRLIASIFSIVTPRNNTYSTAPFEWMKRSWKWTVDKATIFLNPTNVIARSILVDFGIPVSNLKIDENTPTNLQIKHYYEKPKVKEQEIDIKNQTVDTVGGPMSSSGGPIGAGVGGNVPPGTVADGNIPPGNIADGGNNLGQPNVNPTDGHMGANPIGGPDPHINHNVGGVRNGGGFFRNWFGFLGNFWNRDTQTEQSGDPSIVRLMQNQAIKSNSSNAFLNLANIYLLGDEKNGIKKNRTKAIEFLKEAAERGNPQAQYNLGVMFINEDFEYSYHWFKECASRNFSLWFKGLSVIYSYNHPNNTHYNQTKADEYLDLATNLGILFFLSLIR